MTAIRLSDHFTYRRLLRFTAPPILMMIFTAVYSVVDGVFVANFVGGVQFAAINLIMPFLMLFDGFAFMLGAGGSALVAMTLGEGRDRLAREYFSLIVYAVIALGTAITGLGIALLPTVSALLGADAAMLPYCVEYGRIVMLATVPFMLQTTFQTFLITAERPRLGLFITVGAGVANMALDALFMAVFGWGLVGAAAATAIAQCVGGLVPLAYFLSPNGSTLRLGKTRFYGRALLRACGNGFSECLSALSRSFVGMLFNFRLMQLVGERGVSAHGVIMYVNFVFISMFLGFSDGSAPVVGFHYGAQNRDELKSLLRKGLTIVGAFAVLMTGGAELLSRPLAQLFVSYDPELMELTVHAFRLFSLSFLLVGFNIYGSAFFTALNNGAVSAVISVGRSLVFEVAAILVMPELLGVDGLWLASPVSALCAMAVTVFCLVKYRDRYGY
ncbi:MAG: MATE family efflux transporter [Oscillospiraceae bacterium]|nr:MATE family efflux transporter [Oscillospiraceae bacterium]